MRTKISKLVDKYTIVATRKDMKEEENLYVVSRLIKMKCDESIALAITEQFLRDELYIGTVEQLLKDNE